MLSKLKERLGLKAKPVQSELQEPEVVVVAVVEPAPFQRWSPPEGWVGMLPAPPKHLALPFIPLPSTVIPLPDHYDIPERDPEQEKTGAEELMSLTFEAQQVIWLRMAGMGLATPAAMQENHRMVAEKPPAFAQAMFEGTMALMTGHSPEEATRRTAARLREVTSANIKRLTE